MEKVSIIIPVYNVRKEYFDKCIESILNQTYTNLEIIFVDDGSKEETAKLCDLYAEEDSRIVVLHQNNQGVSIARNNGTKIATGAFIMYSDADDILFPSAIEEGLNYLEKTNADMIIAAVTKISPNDVVQDNYNAIADYDVFGNNAKNLDILRNYFLMVSNERYKNINGNSYIGRGPCARLIRSEIAKENYFPVGLPLGEDVIWNMQFTNLCNRICILLKPWYGYVIYDSSCMRKYYEGKREEIVQAYLGRLWEDNKDYCKKHKNEFAKNAAMEFYCILKYELMSKRNNLSRFEKNRIVRKYLNQWPWKLMVKEFKRLPIKYKFMLILCKTNLWQFVIKFV